MRAAIVSIGVSAVLILASAPARAEPAIVLTPASAAPAAPLQSRCVVGPEREGGADVECLVEQPATGGAPASAMRILIQTQAAGPCRSRNVYEIAIPAAHSPSRAGTLPQVVQEGREYACAF